MAEPSRAPSFPLVGKYRKYHIKTYATFYMNIQYVVEIDPGNSKKIKKWNLPTIVVKTL
jgi:hypothetical protein